MNGILRPVLRISALRAFILAVLLLTFTISNGQTINPTIENCPNPVTNVVIESPAFGNCIENFSLASYPTTPDDNTQIQWYSMGATVNGNAMGTIPIDSFPSENFVFNFGLSTVVFVAVDTITGARSTECRTIVFVSEQADLPTTTCDPITVDLADACDGVLTVPYETVRISTNLCDPEVVDYVELSWSMDQSAPATRTTVVDAHSGNPSFYSLYLRKYRDTNFIRQSTCMVRVNFVNELEPVLVCPPSETILVPAECFASYTYDVEGASTLDCGGSFNQTMGAASGTQLTVGTYDYEVEMLDSLGNPVDLAPAANPCTWTVTVEESDLASTELSCQAALNVSIDQNCMATIDVPTILTGSSCTPAAMLTLFAVIDGVEQTGPTLTFTDANVGQTIDVSVIGPNGLNSCWGTVTIEDKIGPAITCPPDQVITCTMPSDTSATGVPTLVGADCDDVSITFSDATVTTMCEGPYQTVISRRFIAQDGAGNFGAPCTQTISIEREDLMNAVLPPHWDGLDMHTGIQDNGVSSNEPLSCDGAGVVYDTLIRSDGRVVPSPYDNGDLIGTGFPGGVGTCGTIFSFYEDLIVEICEENCTQASGSYKVLRTWDVFDWCTGNLLIHQQIIKVMDTIAPVFIEGVPDLTVSTDLWGCGATINLPTVSASDNCSEEIKYSWNVSGGTYDPAANRVYVSSVALTDIGSEVLLIAYAEDCCGNISADTGLVTIIDQIVPVVVADQHTTLTLNNQSDDGHTKIYASSFDDGSWDGCGPIDYWVRRMDNACEGFDGDPETEVDEVADFHKFIHFCCKDVAENQMVVFMVCDDADRDGTPEMNGDDNCSTAMVEVDVQDKLAPTINCPAPRTINCIDFVAYENLLDTDLTDADIDKLNAAFGNAFSNSTCGELGAQTFVSGTDEFCGIGSVLRTFVVTTDNGQATCSQKIDITLSIDNVMSCDRISFPEGSAEDLANYDWCDPSDLVAPFVKTIKVFECGGATITEPLIDRDNLCTEVGINVTLDTFEFAGGACIKILAHWEIIDQCLFEENYFNSNDDEVDPFLEENGYYELYVEYDIFDTDAPTLACDDVTVETSDCEISNGRFTLTATDDCTDADLISITYKVDLGNDGTYDFPVNGSFAEGSTFDALTIGGLTIGTHSIKWAAYDGCGNYEVCSQIIEVVKQDKAPTPYCHLGLSSAVMDSVYGCGVEFWATDFVAGGFDDCDQDLTYLMIPYQDIYGDPFDFDDDLSVEEALDAALPNWEFGCSYITNGKSHVIEIRVYTVDSDGNSDFCDASLTLNDNFDCCADLEFGLSTMISGNVATDEGTILEDVEVSIMSNEPEFPRIHSTSNTGSYIFNSLKYDVDYDLSASTNADAREGVTTLDIVLIQRHILGIATLDSPYKIIAADVNGNSKVSALDLLQLRKLILGLYPNDQLPDNSSWRYVDNAYTFGDVLNPFPFKENISVSNLAQAMYNQNFVGVKVGDVNGSISASLRGDVQVRSDKSFKIALDDQVVNKGSKISVDFTAADIAAVYGMQLGISFDAGALSYENVESRSMTLEAGNVASQEGSLKLSWNTLDLSSFDKDEVLFTVHFNGVGNGYLSQLLQLDQKVLVGEAYSANLAIEEVELVFRSTPISAFELLQNEPNPFADQTAISFNLPYSGSVNLRVYDVTGKVILERNESYAQGLNTTVIKTGEIRTSGVLYYQLTFGNESSTRKMILLD